MDLVNSKSSEDHKDYDMVKSQPEQNEGEDESNGEENSKVKVSIPSLNLEALKPID